jgi:hypothetical protein
MPELLIRYNDNKTLQLLTDLAKYFDYEIAPAIDKSNSPKAPLNLIPGDSSINPEELTEIFTGKNLDAQNLRKEAWKRS